MRLLPPGSLARRAAMAALAAVAVLLVMTGVCVLWALVVALGALAYESRRRAADRRRGRAPAAAQVSHIS